MTTGSPAATVWRQIECDSGVSRRVAHGSGSPDSLTMNWRRSSSSVTSAMSAPVSRWASRVMRSNSASCPAPSRALRSSALRRSSSARWTIHDLPAGPFGGRPDSSRPPRSGTGAGLPGLGGHGLLGVDERAAARRVLDALLEPRVLAVEDLERERVVVVVVVGPQLGEQRVDAAARLLGEHVGQLARLLRVQRLRVHAGRRDGEQLGADVDDAPEERLALLELGLPAAHRVERRARELARVALDEAHVAGQLAELVERAGLLALADRQLGQPLRVELRRLHGDAGLLLEVAVALEDVAGHLEVLIHRLAGDQQVHDLRRALEDAVDAHVAHDLLHGDGLLAARLQRLGGLVAAPAADLHQLVGDLPAQLGGVELGDRRLDADVVALLVGQAAGDVEHGLQAEGAGGEERDLLGDRVVLADRAAPLHALVAPLARDLRRPLADADADRRQRQAAGVQRGQGDLQAVALAPDQVLGRDEDVLEDRDRVLDAAQAHEGVAVLDGDAVGVVVEHEGADAPPVALALGDLGHDDDDVGDRAVGRPQLAAVELVAALDGLGGGAQARRVRADVGLGEQEGRDVVLGHQGQPLLLLLLGAEAHQWLRDADRLVRAEQRRQRARPRAGQRQRLVVVDLRQAEAAVLLGDLHAERAELLEAVDDLFGDLRVALDLQRVDVLDEERAQALEEGLALLDRGGVELGLRVDEVELEVAEEQLLAEARELPVALARVLGDLPGFLLADVGGYVRCSPVSV